MFNGVLDATPENNTSLLAALYDSSKWQGKNNFTSSYVPSSCTDMYHFRISSLKLTTPFRFDAVNACSLEQLHFFSSSLHTDKLPPKINRIASVFKVLGFIVLRIFIDYNMLCNIYTFRYKWIRISEWSHYICFSPCPLAYYSASIHNS